MIVLYFFWMKRRPQFAKNVTDNVIEKSLTIGATFMHGTNFENPVYLMGP